MYISHLKLKSLTLVPFSGKTAHASQISANSGKKASVLNAENQKAFAVAFKKYPWGRNEKFAPISLPETGNPPAAN